MSRAKLLLPFTCNFHYSSYSPRIVVIFYCHYSHTPRQHKWWTQKEQVCLLAAVLISLRLMHNDFVWLYSTLFRHHRNVMEFVCLYAAVAFSPFLDEGKEQRLVAASCVFPEMRCFLPLHRFETAYYYRCASHHSCTSRAHAHFGQSGNTAIKVYTCMYISIKIGIRHLC